MMLPEDRSTELSIFAKIPAARQMDEMAHSNQSPVGTSHAESIRKRSRENAAYSAALEEQLPYEQFARLVIRKRMELNLTQQGLAERMGTSHSVVSRLESGQHRFSFATMHKLAKALNTHLVYGFQDEPPNSKSGRTPKRELVVSA
jgi:ribosome-binding protein aMBF1 (putative translation factor)